MSTDINGTAFQGAHTTGASMAATLRAVADKLDTLGEEEFHLTYLTVSLHVSGGYKREYCDTVDLFGSALGVTPGLEQMLSGDYHYAYGSTLGGVKLLAG